MTMLRSAKLEVALERLDYLLKPLNQSLELPVERALGQVCALDIRTSIDIPPFDRSSMDGYAMRCQDTLRASPENPVKLTIVGTVYAGTLKGREQGPGEAVAIMTGAAMPAGADCMLPKEILTVEADKLIVGRAAKVHENYIFRGEDIKNGQIFIKAQTKLTFAHLAMLAATGHKKVLVFKEPSIGILCVGEEFSPAGLPLEDGKIYNSNGIMLTSRLTELGFRPSSHLILPDDPDISAQIIREAAKSFDILISTGSVSVGDKDIMARVFKLLEVEADLHQLAFKPGSAFLCGRYQEKPFFCLSGNPFAALATFELIVRPALAKLAHRPELSPSRGQAILRSHYGGGKGLNRPRRFLRARLDYRAPGALPEVYLPDDQSSGRLFSLAGCNCLVDMAEGLKELALGTKVEVVKLDLNTP
ncbi:MAG: molybdopterin molybdotransferase MoeA [Deltaproteobacteria bacterium]|jgi:molybdopterin molybdotransferase|nr:molybdopterin molybdotransferase MoeA [Deltaproteobacteria bacterium]